MMTDFCQNMAGVVTFTLPAGLGGAESAGRVVSLLHAEAVHGPPPATIYHHYWNSARQLCFERARHRSNAVSTKPWRLPHT